MEESHRIANGMEFVNDPAVIGKWKSVGSLEAGEEFSLEKLNASQKGELAEEIYFLPQGVSYWIFEGWTKGTLLLHYGGDAPILERSYQVVSREGRKYLLVTLPEEGHIAVFEQVDNTEYALESLGRGTTSICLLCQTRMWWACGKPWALWNAQRILPGQTAR